VRACATNSTGTGYGNEVSFTPPGTIADIDGNVYNTIKIGTHTWIIENLKTTKFKDGSSIALVTNNTTWMNNTGTPAYCWFNNDISNKSIYGALYNWYTVNTGKLAPKDWHVATQLEWLELVDHVGGDSVAGGKLKEAGLTHWITPNTGATNETIFSALPGGCRGEDGSFYEYGYIGGWWSSDEIDPDPVYFILSYSDDDFSGGSCDKRRGFSIRCIKD
jgi:uncharacterized protein (TIGR02145 family)